MQKRTLMTDYNAVVCDNGNRGEPPYVAWVREIDHVVVCDTIAETVQALGDGLHDLLEDEREYPGGDMAPPSDGIASAAFREAQSRGVSPIVHKHNDNITIHLYDLTGTKPSDFYKESA